MKFVMAMLAVVSVVASAGAAEDHEARLAHEAERIREQTMREMEQSKTLVLTRLPARGEGTLLTLERSWWKSLRAGLQATTRLKSPKPRLAMDDSSLVGWRISAGGTSRGPSLEFDFRESGIRFDSAKGVWASAAMGDDPGAFLRLIRLAQPRDVEMKALADRQVPPPTLSPDADPRLGQYVYVEELPEVVHRVAPTYPEGARRRGVEGTVMVQALVGKDGAVPRTQLVRGVAGLDEAAEASVRQWRFKPARAKGEPVAVWVAVPVAFKLH